MNSLWTSFTTQTLACTNHLFAPPDFSHRLESPTVVLRPPAKHRRSSGVVCMAEPYLITKLESAEKTWKELSVKLADPDVVSNPSDYQKLAQSIAELDEVVATYRRFKECEKQLEDAKALSKEEGDDEDMAEMIGKEIETLTSELKELEESLKVLLLPADPLDSRNIMLEVRAGTGGDEAGIWAGDLVDSDGAHIQLLHMDRDLDSGLQVARKD